jgi:hypothetical protein
MPALKSTYNYFLETNLEKYKGEWIAIFDNKIVSHGKDLKKLVEEAKEICADKKFLLAKVPSDETMIF